jgi:hypothetical protein
MERAALMAYCGGALALAWHGPLVPGRRLTSRAQQRQGLGCHHIEVSLRYTGPHDGRGALRIEVTDDGTGGADPAKGTGLAGVERRLAAFDGILAVSSPLGGPTMIAMEVPCALS